MAGDAPVIERHRLSPRAATALLTLQLRGVLHEASAAEAAADAVDVDTVLQELRAKVLPLIEERRRVLDEDLLKARTDAAAAIAAAHREASLIGAAASAEVAEVAEVAEIAEATRADDGTRAAEPAEVEGADGILVVEATEEMSVWAPPLPAPPAPAAGRLPILPGPIDPGAVTVVLDAESFARAFALAMAPILERSTRAPGSYPPGRWVQSAPVEAPRKRSFWANAWHVDVLLSGIAMVIVLAVLVAWTS